MERVPAVPICEHFASLTDPRCANARHHFLDSVVMAVCAVLCGAAGWEDIEA
jgi:DDE_Tnp_1-associated